MTSTIRIADTIMLPPSVLGMPMKRHEDLFLVVGALGFT